MYKLTNGNEVIHPDGFAIPNDELNKEWQEYQKWLKAGNKPLAADPPPPDPEVIDLPALFDRLFPVAKSEDKSLLVKAISN